MSKEFDPKELFYNAMGVGLKPEGVLLQKLAILLGICRQSDGKIGLDLQKEYKKQYLDLAGQLGYDPQNEALILSHYRALWQEAEERGKIPESDLVKAPQDLYLTF